MVQAVQTSGSLRQVQHEQHDDHHNRDDHPGVHYILPVGSGQAADELTAHIVLDLLARRGDAFIDLFDLAGDNLPVELPLPARDRSERESPVVGSRPAGRSLCRPVNRDPR